MQFIMWILQHNKQAFLVTLSRDTYLGNELQKDVKCPLFHLLIHSCPCYSTPQNTSMTLSLRSIPSETGPSMLTLLAKGEYLMKICLSVLSFHTWFKTLRKYEPKGRLICVNMCYLWWWCSIDIITLSIATNNLMCCYLSGRLLCVVYNRHSVNAC